MTRRYKVARADDFEADGDRVIREVEGVEIAVFRVDGDYYALANYCVHQGGPLCDGELTGRVYVQDDGWAWRYEDTDRYVLCPWHGWMFDVTTGKNVDVARYSVPTYEVEVVDGDVYVVR